MRKIIALSLCMFLLVTASAVAGHIPWPVKWSQLPTPEVGLDSKSMHPYGNPQFRLVADDWLCDVTGPIAVRWWGSYHIDGVDNAMSPYLPGAMVPFEVVIYDSTSPPVMHPDSEPDDLLYWDFLVAEEDPYLYLGNDQWIYEYNLYIPPEDFIQYAGNEYWLSVAYDTSNAVFPLIPDCWWGWAATYQPHLDYAQWTVGVHETGPWYDMADRAFEIMIPEPGTILLVGMALVGLAGVVRKRLF